MSTNSINSNSKPQLPLDDSKERYPRSSGFPIRGRALFGMPRRSDRLIAQQLECPSASDKILRSFKKSLKSSNSGANLRATAHGSSGYTLLGNGPVKAFDPASAAPADQDEQVGIVLKWIPHRAAKDEYACNELAKAFGLDVPVMQSVSKETSSLFVSPTKRQKPSFNEGPFQLIAMNRIDGMNLSQLCLSGAIFALKPSSWQQMMYQFGQAAILDLFSGNFDRFIRFQMNQSGEYEFVQDPEANAGNVMVHTTPQRGNISSVAFIDNTSLAPPSKPAVEKDEEVDLDFSLFGVNEPEAAPITPPRTPEKQSENPAIVKGLNAFFVSTIKELERDSNALAEHITSAVKKAILNAVKEEVDLVSARQSLAIESALIQANGDLKQGLLDGLLRLKNPAFQKAALSSVETGSKSLNQLVRLNLFSLEERQLEPSKTVAAGPIFPTNSLSGGSTDHEDSALISSTCGSLESTEPSLTAS